MGSDEVTTKILIEIRDSIRQTNERLDQTNERLAILATLTRSIDGRVAKLEAREPDRLFLPQRVQQLEASREDHEARLAALEKS